MHAIGHYVLTHDPDLKLTYISAERFMNEMINAIRYDRILEFRERYRSVDVLLVDDIQFLVGQGRHADRVLPHVQRAATTRRSRSSSAATVRRTRSRSSRSGCAPASSGA